MALVQEVRNATDKQHATLVTLSNQTPATMTLDRSIIWSGPSAPIPTTIMPGGGAAFTGAKKGAVIYDGLNAAAQPCAWVLAWDAPAPSALGTPKKVYVRCGYKQVIDKMSFDEIEKSLEASASTCTYTDVASRTTASATAVKSDDIVTVGSSFGLML